MEIKQKRTESITIKEVNKFIVNNVFEAWEKLCHDLESGDITFQEFGNHFGEMKKKVVNEELNLIADTSSDDQKQWIKQRLFQFDHYKVLRERVKGAKVITEFAKQFDLNGNFDEVQKMMKLVCIHFFYLSPKLVVSIRTSRKMIANNAYV